MLLTLKGASEEFGEYQRGRHTEIGRWVTVSQRHHLGVTYHTSTQTEVIRMAVIKNKCQWGCGEKGNRVHFGGIARWCSHYGT